MRGLDHVHLVYVIFTQKDAPENAIFHVVKINYDNNKALVLNSLFCDSLKVQ